MRNLLAPLLLLAAAILGPMQPSPKKPTTPADSSKCKPPNYCADTSAGIRPYGGSVTSPPLRNQAFTDPTFNRKIWRITDARTSTKQPNTAMGVPFQSFRYADAWNLNDTVFMAGQQNGGASLIKMDLSNPTAPVATPWPCTSGKFCMNGFLQPGAYDFISPWWSQSSNYKLYGINGLDMSLWQADLDYSNHRSPVISSRRLYSPYDAGECLAGTKPGDGTSYTQASPDDNYFWGFLAPKGTNYAIILHKSGHGCIYLNLGVFGWSIGGDSKIAHLGALIWTDDAGNLAPGPGNGCTVHGASYDYISDTVLIDSGTVADATCFGNVYASGRVAAGSTATSIKATLAAGDGAYNGGTIQFTSGPQAGCFEHITTYVKGAPGTMGIDNVTAPGCGAPNTGDSFTIGVDSSPTILVHLSDGHAAHITHPYGVGLGGHGMGLANVGGVVGDLSGYGGFIWNPTTIAVAPPRWTQVVPSLTPGLDQHGSNSDYISRRSTLPIVGATSWIDHSFVPPLNSYRVTRAYEGEITVSVIPSVTESAATTYRFVHNYSAAGGNAYGAQAFPAISHDRCWVAFSSNWFGHLGDTSANEKSKQCSVAGNCRYDVFLTYLCGPSDTQQ